MMNTSKREDGELRKDDKGVARAAGPYQSNGK